MGERDREREGGERESSGVRTTLGSIAAAGPHHWVELVELG